MCSANRLDDTELGACFLKERVKIEGNALTLIRCGIPPVAEEEPHCPDSRVHIWTGVGRREERALLARPVAHVIQYIWMTLYKEEGCPYLLAVPTWA